ELARYIHRKTGTKRLCLAGGVALNGRANYEILRQTPIEEIWVQPGCSDAGLPFGLALWGYYQIVGPKTRSPRANVQMRHAYCGREYPKAETEAILERYGIGHRTTAATEIAGWLGEEKIVAI